MIQYSNKLEQEYAVRWNIVSVVWVVNHGCLEDSEVEQETDGAFRSDERENLAWAREPRMDEWHCCIADWQRCFHGASSPAVICIQCVVSTVSSW